MRSLFTHKFWVILLAVLALGAMMELAIGMKSMSFHEAQAFGRNERDVNLVNPGELVSSLVSIPTSTLIIFSITLLLLMVLISLLLSPEARKRLLLFLFRMMFTFWALYMLVKRYPHMLDQFAGLPNAAKEAASQQGNGLPPPVFTPPQPSSWFTYVISLAIAAVLIFVAWRAYRIWQKMNSPARGSIDELAKIARSSLRDLNSGGESTDVILNCYYRMSDVVAEKKHLERRLSMTPNEFALRLERAGLPVDAVQRLTSLFETVRYGGRRTSPQMINEAVSCLTSILHYCGESV
jgi:hypothetical protein